MDRVNEGVFPGLRDFRERDAGVVFLMMAFPLGYSAGPPFKGPPF